jgi:hypothetical protein
MGRDIYHSYNTAIRVRNFIANTVEQRRGARVAISFMIFIDGTWPPNSIPHLSDAVYTNTYKHPF